jgi:hypothetical protein
MPRSASVLVLLLCGCAIDSGFKRFNDAPTAAISAPGNGDTFRQGAGILVVVGSVSDPQDDADALTVTLTANGADVPVTVGRDGLVGAQISVDALPLGELTLTLAVVDTEGDTGVATVSVNVEGPLGPPAVTIESPEDGAAYLFGDTVAFRGTATDTTTPADALTFDWYSSLDGVLEGAVSGGGASAVFSEALTLGTHVVTLTVTDADGEVGTDAVTVLIEEEPVDSGPDEEPDEVEPGDMLFSEMMVNPQAVDDEVGEWVELYNTADSAIDIGGYTFRDEDIDAWVLDGPLVVPAHGFVVLCADMDPAVNGGVPCDGWFLRKWNGGGLALANSPDELILARPDGLVIDTLAYDETWFVPAVARGVDQGALDAGDNDAGGAWCDQTTLTAPMTEPGTPGTTNDPC